jgi:hypothetical protein
MKRFISIGLVIAIVVCGYFIQMPFTTVIKIAVIFFITLWVLGVKK